MAISKTTSAKKTVAVKKTATKTVATKKVAAKTVLKKTDSAKAPKSVAGALTRIIAKLDAGWGNSVYIRGNGAGLSWHKGVLMQCVDSDEWLWENKVAKGAVEFKILINDEVWALGDDLSVKAGETITCHPSF